MIKRVFKAFEYRDFRLMWFGACTSSIGTWMQSLAQAWLVYDLSKDPFYLGLDLFLAQFPIMALSLFGGVVADRHNRRNILLISQFIQMSCAFTLTALLYFDVVQVWHILCLSSVVGIGQAFGGPAYSALLPTLVGPEDFPNAIALNSFQFNLARVVGPTIGGLALDRLGAVWCFGLNGLSFLAVITSLTLIHMRYIPPKTTEPILDSMKKGIGFIRRQTGMEALIILAFLMTVLGMPLMGFLPVFAKDVFKGNATTYSTLLVSSGLGSVCGALIVAGLKRRGQGRTALVILMGMGMAIIGFSLSRWLPLSCLLIFTSGAAVVGVFSVVMSLVQTIATDDMRGRVMSVFNMALRGGMPVGSLILGKLIPIFGVSFTMAWSGGFLSLLALYYLLVQRRVAAL